MVFKLSTDRLNVRIGALHCKNQVDEEVIALVSATVAMPRMSVCVCELCGS